MCILLKEMFAIGAAQQETVLLVVTGHLCPPGAWSWNGSSEMSAQREFLVRTVGPEQSWLLQPEHAAPPSPQPECWEVPWGSLRGHSTLCMLQTALAFSTCK